MDEKGFKSFLKGRGYTESTVKAYVIAVKEFERWLCEHGAKSLEEVNESDLRACKKLTRNPAYVFGIRVYYEHQDKKEIVKTIVDKIMPKLPKYRPKDVIRWTEFRNIMKQLEKEGASDRDRVLLNILWSRMKSWMILELRISDIDFEKRVVNSRVDLKTYRVTPEAWEALKNFIPIERRGERKRLFPKIKSVRTVQQITKDHFGFRNITPNLLRLSCEEDFIETGKKKRFSMPDKKPSIRVEKPQKEKKKTSFFNRLVEEIENFGSDSRVHYRIPKIKGKEPERDFKRMLEGYLLATFPEEIIISEFRFKGYEGDSQIDFAVGKAPKIPIEVKWVKEKIRGKKGEGSEQVIEFLESRRREKGILVIVIKDRGRVYELARKFNGLRPNGVHVIII